MTVLMFGILGPFVPSSTVSYDVPNRLKTGISTYGVLHTPFHFLDHMVMPIPLLGLC